MTDYVLLTNKYSKLLAEVTLENRLLAELLQEERQRYSLMVKSREKWKTMYETLCLKVKNLL